MYVRSMRRRITRRQALKYLASGSLAVVAPQIFSLNSLSSKISIASGLSVKQLSDSPGWHLTNPYGISFQNPEYWWTGHISDVIIAGGAIVAGADAGGIWFMNPNNLSRIIPPEYATQDLMPSPNFGPLGALVSDPNDSTHFYAGGNGFLYESPGSGDLGPMLPTNIPSGVSQVTRIALTNPSRDIILATDNGVYWAPIGQPPTLVSPGSWTKSPYQWQNIPGNNTPQQSYSGLAAGLADTFAIAPGGGPFFFGKPSGGGYALEQVSSPWDWITAFGRLGRISLASGPSSNPTRFYALGGLDTDFMAGVLWSEDGGQSWNPSALTLNGAPNSAYTILSTAGNQQWWNQSIAVSPQDRNLVAAAFRTGSPFISTDGGNTWNLITPQWSGGAVQGYSSPLLQHSDLHCVYFDPTDSNGKRLFVASDGGLARIDDCTNFNNPTGTTAYNQYLPLLEFNSTATARGGNNGSFDVLPLSDGSFLLVGGLQDNGDVYTVVGPGNQVQPWNELDGGDGGYDLFIATERNDLIAWCNTCGSSPPVIDYYWNGNGFSGGNVIPLSNQGSPPDASGLFGGKGGGGAVIISGCPRSFLLTPPQATLNAANQFMYAVATILGLPNIWGLFANTDSSNMHWEQLGTVNIDVTKDQIYAIGSGRGDEVFVGTKNGKYGILSPAYSSQSTIDLVDIRSSLPQITASITQFLCAPDDSVTYIAAGGNLLALTPGPGAYLLTTVGRSSNQPKLNLPNDETIYGLAADWGGGRLWVGNNNKVFQSNDQGASWTDISDGLPLSPNCCDLRYSKPYLFLSTYGRSVWHTNVG